MAHETTQPVHYEDMVGVRSRVSWGAILGGTVIALACYLVLTFFFAAVGFSLNDADVRSDTIGIGAIVAAIVSIAVSLFVGGWVATQLTAGETTREAVIYGVLTWAAVTAAMLMMIGMGMRAGYSALVGGTLVAQNTPAVQERIDAAKQGLDPNRAAAAATLTPEEKERAQKAAVIASWSALAGTLLAIGAAIGGALAGRGPTFRLFPVATQHKDIIIAR